MDLKSLMTVCHGTLLLVLTDEELCDIACMDDSEVHLLHFTLGLWLRNQILTEGGCLYLAFLEEGIEERDDMSRMLLLSFRRLLRDYDLHTP